MSSWFSELMIYFTTILDFNFKPWKVDIFTNKSKFVSFSSVLI